VGIGLSHSTAASASTTTISRSIRRLLLLHQQQQEQRQQKIATAENGTWVCGQQQIQFQPQMQHAAAIATPSTPELIKSLFGTALCELAVCIEY
jgi:hypothetical protein